MTPRVWSIEDSHHDQEALRRALKRAGHEVNLHEIADGDSALQKVQELSRGHVDPPDLVLLDLNLGARSGFEVLALLKGDAVMRRVPVVILTSSLSSRDVAAAYDAGANAVVQKPLALRDYYATVQNMVEFWLHIASSPAGR